MKKGGRGYNLPGAVKWTVGFLREREVPGGGAVDFRERVCRATSEKW